MYDHLYEVTIAELQSEIDDLKKENKTLSGRYHRLENYLKEHQARNHSLFFTNESVKCIISPFSGNIMSCNQEAVRFYGYPQEEMLRMKIFDISILAEPQIQKDLVRARNGWQKVFHDKHRLQDGQIRDVESRISPLQYRGILALFMIIFDITPYKRIEEMLSNTVEETQRLPDYKRSECLHRGRSYELVSILDNLDIQVWNLCDGETYGLVNKAHAEFLGSSKSEIENKSIFYFWPQDDALFLQDMNRQALEKKERLSVKRLIHTSNGGEYLFRLSFCPQFTDSGNLETIICSAEDITEYEQSKQEIQKNQEMLTSQSFCDELTGIPNRRCFNDVLKKEWGRSKRLASPLSILLADIDHFKEFNDTYGHLAGDECLKKVANVLMNSIQRSTDFVARFGGEEFIVILPNTTLDGAICMAEKMRKLVQFQKIRHINSHVTDVVTISIGVGHMVPLVSLQDIDEQKLLYAADQALYKAKNNGRNQVEYIDVRCDGSRKEISSDTI